MKVLMAISSSSLKGSAAVFRDGVFYEKVFQSALMSHSESIVPSIKEVLRDSNTALEDVNVFAFDAGPGSFTGIRVGYVTACGLFFARGKEVVRKAFSSLDVIAFNAVLDERFSEFTKGSFLAVADAGRNEYFAALYGGGGFKKVREERLVPFDELKGLMESFPSFGYLNRKNSNVFMRERIIEMLPSARGLLEMVIRKAGNERDFFPYYLRKPNIIMKKR